MPGEVVPQHPVGFTDCPGAPKAEFTYQAILEGPPETLNTTSCLRRAGAYAGDVKLGCQASELSSPLLTSKLFLQGLRGW